MTTLVFFSGFLGSGKTTLITKLVNYLKTEGLSSAVITNDQSANLVDSSFIKSATSFGKETKIEEITDGCFCCRFEELLNAVKNIMSFSHYDYIFAEAVGSCTDIRATVILPLTEYHKYLDMKIAPIFILLDGSRIENEYKNMAIHSPKTPKAVLIKHQIDEAQILLISKKDKIKDLYYVKNYGDFISGARKISYNVNSEEDIKTIRLCLDETLEIDKTFLIDYDIYAKAEAELGWYNGSWEIESKDKEIDIELYASFLLENIAGKNVSEIAHAKCYIAAKHGGVKISLVSGMLESDGVFRNAKTAKIILNIRAEREPLTIAKNVETAMNETKTKFDILILNYKHTEITPSYPKPFYHMEK